MLNYITKIIKKYYKYRHLILFAQNADKIKKISNAEILINVLQFS